MEMLRSIGCFTAVIVALAVQGCQTLAPHQEWPYHGWTQQDVMSRTLSRSIPHHWGQKDQAIPNNGWTNYAYLKYSQENIDSFAVFKQNQGELSAELYIANVKEMHAISIPRAGIFYQGSRAPTCMPDHIESLGLEAEWFLFILSKAFPDGPEIVNREMSVKVHGDTELTIRFMQAYGNMPPGWSFEVTIKPVAVSQYIITIREISMLSPSDVSNTFTLFWKGRGGEVISSGELLTNWMTCWHGITKKREGGYWHEPFVKDAESLQTFGQVREQIPYVTQ